MTPSYLAVISAAAAVVVAVALVKVFRFCAAWLAGRRKYNSSSLPGPPLTHQIYGEYAELANCGQGGQAQVEVGCGRSLGSGYGSTEQNCSNSRLLQRFSVAALHAC